MHLLVGEIIKVYLDPKLNVDTNSRPKASGLNILDEKLAQVRFAQSKGQLTGAQAQALIDQIADGCSELLAYAALTTAGIKAYNPKL